MSMALLLTLLLPVMQEDPQVMYREGLFEEVDQGNLEKAAELYGKVLKSGAPDALKAKALLRTGFCHDKKGKKKEAEQAWRDVIERYPNAGEAVKIARDRIESVGRGAKQDPTAEAQVKQLILDLGAQSDDRHKAMRRLTLMGDEVIPELRAALQHRDSLLHLGAAYVLLSLESYSGIYDVMKRYWPKPPEAWAGDKAGVLGSVLKNSEEDRKRFIKDMESLSKAPLVPYLVQYLLQDRDPQVMKIVEDALVESSTVPTWLFQNWQSDKSVEEVRKLLKRLLASTPPAHDKIAYLLEAAADGKAAQDPEFKSAAKAALANHSNPGVLLTGDVWIPVWIFKYLTPAEFAKGPLEAWVTKSAPAIRDRILSSVSRQLESRNDWPELNREMRDLLFAIMAAPDSPKDIRERIFAHGLVPDTPERWERVIAYCLQYFKENRAKPPEESDQGMMQSVLDRLLNHLPLDSKDLPAVIESAVAVDGFPFDIEPKRFQPMRGLIVRATLRAREKMPKEEMNEARYLGFIEQHATPVEKLELGKMLPSMPESDALLSMASMYGGALLNQPKADLEESWQPAFELLEQEQMPPPVRRAVLGPLVGADNDHVHALMRYFSDSKDLETRRVAIDHFGATHTAERGRYLIAALKDSAAEIQLLAISHLVSRPVFESIPELIKLFGESSEEVRNAAQEALASIRKHYEAQAEWKRWYDELKKTLEK